MSNQTTTDYPVTEPQVFEHADYGKFQVIVKDGEPWFIAKDVCKYLEISNSRDAVSRLDDDEKDGVGLTDSIGRVQKSTIISESGLFSLVMRSDKPEAKKFQKWVTKEVLPTIRKTGAYAPPDPAQSILNDIRKTNEILSTIADQRENPNPPSSQDILTQVIIDPQTEKMLNQMQTKLRYKGINVDTNYLFNLLNSYGYLYHTGKSFRLCVPQERQTLTFEEITTAFPDGRIKTTKTIKVSGNNLTEKLPALIKPNELSYKSPAIPENIRYIKRKPERNSK